MVSYNMLTHRFVAPSPPPGSSSLRIAVSAAEPCLATVQNLLESGCDVNETWDPQRIGRHVGLPEPVSQPGARISPLHTAIANCKSELAKLLLLFGANPELRSTLGTTALHEAVKQEQQDIVAALIECGADTEATVENSELEGWTCLHLAVASGNLRTTLELLNNGAVLTAPTKYGWTSFDIALLDRQRALTHLLIQHSPAAIYPFAIAHSDPIELSNVSIDRHHDAAIHLLRYGVTGADMRHRLLYSRLLFGLFTMAEFNQTKYDSVEAVANLIWAFEAQLASLASVSFKPPTGRNLCARCQAFQNQDVSSMFNVYHHSDDSASLVQSAKDGCQLCKVLCAAWNTKRGRPYYVAEVPTTLINSQSVKLQVIRADQGLESTYKICIGCDSTGSSLSLRHVEEPLSHAISETSQLDTSSARSQRTFATIRAWMKICNSYDSHDICRSNNVSGLPARLIDVRDALSDPVLHHTIGSERSYTALSYCWGSGQNIKTTKANIEEHSRGIPLQSMPKTIQDAIRITRELQIQYLWVDTLCIIQDSFEDFLHEGGRMQHIYRNATLTIAVEDSLSCSEGFLHERSWSCAPVLPLDFCVPTRMGEHKRSSVVQRLMAVPEVDIQYGSGYSALQSRAWTLQELLLSLRVLHCEKNEMRWSCLKGAWSETQPSHLSISRRDFSNLRSRILQYTNRKESSDKEHGFYGWWQFVVSDYSRRQLSRPTDKLIAFSGLQQIFGVLLEDVPVAGTWRHQHFFPSLTWFHFVAHTNTCTRQDQIGYPSWSWASVDGHVQFYGVPKIRYSVELRSWNIVVVEANMKYSGSITLRGSLFRDILGTADQAQVEHEKWGKPEYGSQFSGPKPFAASKTLKDARFPIDMKNVWYLLLGISPTIGAITKRPPTAFLMCLEKLAEDKMQFRRVGIACTSNMEANNRYEKWESSGCLESFELF